MKVERFIILEGASSFSAYRMFAELSAIEAELQRQRTTNLYENVYMTARPEAFSQEAFAPKPAPRNIMPRNVIPLRLVNA